MVGQAFRLRLWDRSATLTEKATYNLGKSPFPCRLFE
jgi:hypothetical protein